MKSAPQRKRKKKWMLAALAAVILFLGDVAVEVLSNDLGKIPEPYRYYAWATLALAFIAAIIMAIKESRTKDDPPQEQSQSERNISAGEVKDSILVTGNDNIIANHVHGDVACGNNTLNIYIQGDLIQRDKIISTYLPEITAPSSMQQLPAPPRDFTGRNEEIAELLHEMEKGVTVFGLHGLGGVGKTALALKLAEKIKYRYPGAQFYFDLKGVSANPLQAVDAMTHVIRTYHPTAKLPDSESELKTIYQFVLCDKRALLLMDDAKDRAQVELLLPPAGCALIVTSRMHFTLPGLYEKDLDSMTGEDAREMLLGIAPRIKDQADEIAKLCGRLPLALRVAASAMAERKNLTPAEYTRRLSNARQRLAHLKEVDTALSVSYELLSEESQRMWRMLAVFPDTFDENAAAAIWEMEADTVKDTLGDLMTYSLIEYDEETGRYNLQDLARLFARGRLSEAEQETSKRRYAINYKSVLSQANVLYLKGGDGVKGGLALYDLELRNIEEGWKWAESMAEADDKIAQLCIEYPYAGMVILKLRQHPRERIQWLEAALTAARRLKQRGHESSALGNLGSAYDELGDSLKAIELYEQSLAIAREMGNRRDEGAGLGNIGLAYLALGDAGKAIEYIEQHLAIARELGIKQSEANALCNLGMAYAELGNLRKAIEYYEQSLPIQREKGNLRFEGNVLRNLGDAYTELGEADKAIKPYEQALGIYREIGDRLGESAVLSHLGMAYVALDKSQEAIECLEKCLELARETRDLHVEGGALCNIGLAYARLNETQKAVEFYKQSLVINRETGNRRFEANVLLNLGNACTALDEKREAIESYEHSLEIYREIGDKRRESYVLWGLGFAYHKFKEPLKALEFYEQYLTMARESGYRRSEGQALNLMGSAYADLNEPVKAIESYKQAIAIACETGDRWGEGNALWNMSLALDTLGEGEHERAVEYAEAALKVKEEIGDSCAEKVRNKLKEWHQSDEKEH